MINLLYLLFYVKGHGNILRDFNTRTALERQREAENSTFRIQTVKVL
jgi:hypothetical protein